MRFLVGLDDTDSSRGYCTTYLAYRIAVDLRPGVRVLPYPRLVRLNPNIPFKTRGNAAVCLRIEADDPGYAFERVRAKVEELSDVAGGANSGMVFLESPSSARPFEQLYHQALSGVVSPYRVRRLLADAGARTYELGNGMGLVGAASSLGFDERFDHTYELIAYRRKEAWGTPRVLDSSSVRAMDLQMFPHLFNNYDYQKRKVLVSPHGPDPVFAGVRGDSPANVLRGFETLRYGEQLEGHMVYLTNQHTDAHLSEPLDWKVYSSGWFEGTVEGVRIGEGGHAYVTMVERGRRFPVAAYEPTGDLTRTVRRLRKGDRIRAFGGVRKGTSLHPKILNLEKLEVLSSRNTSLPRGAFVSSTRANRHLTKPLIRYGREDYGRARAVDGWLGHQFILPRVRA
jgi:tRNA(Ile2)-agmatinylcytidine synthase